MTLYSGTLPSSADSVFLQRYADDKPIETESQRPKADKSYSFTLKLEPGLVKWNEDRRHRDGRADGI